MTTPLTGWYQAAKHALEALSDALRVEVASDGIAVALIEPGAFRSNIWEGAGNDLQRRIDSEYFTAYKRLETGIKASQRLMGDPIEVARVIAGVMTAKSPKPRYLVGYDARAIDIYSKVLPTEVRDRLAAIHPRALTSAGVHAAVGPDLHLDRRQRSRRGAYNHCSVLGRVELGAVARADEAASSAGRSRPGSQHACTQRRTRPRCRWGAPLRAQGRRWRDP